MSSPTAEAVDYVFTESRMAYRLDLAGSGTDVIDRVTGTRTLVPFGQVMQFAGHSKFSKPSRTYVRSVRAHLEAYGDWERLVDLPVDFLRTGAHTVYGPGGWPSGELAPDAEQPRIPDRGDKAIVAYVNASEFSAIGGWDPSFNAAWDKDGDAIIDSTAGDLPPYVDRAVFNAPWKNYVAVYWTEAWKQQLARKIDLAATQHFDGVMLDVMTAPWTWKDAYPQMDLAWLRLQMADLFRWISNYARQKYGSAFLITANLDIDAKDYFPDLGQYVDGGYYQNAFFEWTGSGEVNGFGLSTRPDRYENPAIDFLRAQGLAVLDMDHLGTGPVTPGLEFPDYDDRITPANLKKLLAWAIASGSTPYCAPVFFATPFSMTPRFVRIVPGRPPTTDTPYADWVIGSAADDVIDTGAGDDVVYGGPGNDTINGGSGSNTAYYSGGSANFRFEGTNQTIVLHDRTGAEGTDTLTGVQVVQFANRQVALAEVLLSGAIVRAVHITDLRARIDMLRTRYNLSTFLWSEPLTGRLIRAAHIQELRTAIQELYEATGRATPAFMDPTIVPGATVVRAVHVQELRDAAAALETN